MAFSQVQAKKSNNFQLLQERDFRKISVAEFSLQIGKFYIQLRDYPMQLLEVERISAQGKGLACYLAGPWYLERPFRALDKRIYYTMSMAFGQITLNLGLCMSSGINELSKRIDQMFSQGEL